MILNDLQKKALGFLKVNCPKGHPVEATSIGLVMDTKDGVRIPVKTGPCIKCEVER